MPGSPDVKIFFVTAEAAPFAKVGGLADVAGALPAALRGRGADVRVIIPCYRQILENSEFDLQDCATGLAMDLGAGPMAFSVKTTVLNEVPFYFIDFPEFFGRDKIYGFEDDSHRFAAFCKGVLEFMRVRDWTPDVVHCNDWQTAAILGLLRTVLAQDPFFSRMAAVFSIHNLAYQGIVNPDMLPVFGIPWSEFDFHRLEFYGQANIMKAGIYYSDRICTVSPTYALEILTQEYGHRLDGMLREHAHKISGIINGIDTGDFTPETDPHITAHFSSASLDGKQENKAALLREMGLQARDADLSAPVLGMVARLADQKGLDILAPCLDSILSRNVRLVILGSGEPRYEDLLREIAAQNPGKMAVRIGFDEGLARRIYAGSDMFLMPSQFEPCGLGQMIAMRYGTVPVVRATGGLRDTVAPFVPVTLRGNGFVFEDYTSTALAGAVFRAVDLYYNDCNAWSSLRGLIMEQDFSWNASAGAYLDLYTDAVKTRMQER